MSLTENQQKMIDGWKTGYVLDHTYGSADHWPIRFDPDVTNHKEEIEKFRKDLETYSLTDLEIVMPFIINLNEWYKEAKYARPKQVQTIIKFDKLFQIDVSQSDNHMLFTAIDAYNKEAILLILNHPNFRYCSDYTPIRISSLFDWDREEKPKVVEKLKFVLQYMKKFDKLMFLVDITNEFRKKKKMDVFEKLYDDMI